jgi:hypothetical protein
MTSKVGMFPADGQKGQGFVILSNEDSSRGPEVLGLLLADYLLGLPFVDWNMEYLARQQAAMQQQQQAIAAAQDAMAHGTPAKFPVSAYAGQYYNAAYGDAVFSVTVDGARLQAWLGLLPVGSLQHVTQETFAMGPAPESLLQQGTFGTGSQQGTWRPSEGQRVLAFGPRSVPPSVPPSEGHGSGSYGGRVRGDPCRLCPRAVQASIRACGRDYGTGRSLTLVLSCRAVYSWSADATAPTVLPTHVHACPRVQAPRVSGPSTGFELPMESSLGRPAVFVKNGC